MWRRDESDASMSLGMSNIAIKSPEAMKSTEGFPYRYLGVGYGPADTLILDF